MALFKKKGKKEEVPQFPELPQLPELPELPEMYENNEEQLPQLPTFPNGSLGNRFSQNTIKEAITGRKREEEAETDEFAEQENMQRMRRPPLIREERMRESPPEQQIAEVKEAEPIFIRIDKFEESSKTFDEVRRQILDIERMFENIQKVKEDEEKELENWEKEIKEIKEKIERIDNDIFSKIE